MHIIPSPSLIATMSFGCRILIFGLFLVVTFCLVNGAAVPNSFGNMQPQFLKDAQENVRNGSLPATADAKSFTPMEQMRQNSQNIPPPLRPFGTLPNVNMFQMPPPNAPPRFVMMPQPPGFRPGMMMMQQTPPPPRPANGPNQQQGQAQLPKREISPMPDSTIAIEVPLLNSNSTRQNDDNTRREAEMTTVNLNNNFQPPIQETERDVEQKESDGSKLKQTPVSPFLNPQLPPQPLPIAPTNPMLQHFNPMMQPFGPMMMNQPPLFVDPMGRLMMLVPFDPSRLHLPTQPGPQGPQGPPLPIQIPFGQPQLRPIMPNISRQPPRIEETSNNGTTSN